MYLKKKTSWQKVAPWYESLTGEWGHFFHEKVIFPLILPWIQKMKPTTVVDFGCGSAPITTYLSQDCHYTGYDTAVSLLRAAKKGSKNPHSRFIEADVTRPIENIPTTSVALCILALQNMENGEECIKNAARAVLKNGIFIIVINHPYFRIPRQSAWGVDEKNKLVYRRVNRYLSPLSIPITMHPGEKRGSDLTWSFHNPLQTYSRWLAHAGFAISDIRELTSPKKSQGKHAREEDRGREEFPLFMALRAVKL